MTTEPTTTATPSTPPPTARTVIPRYPHEIAGPRGRTWTQETVENWETMVTWPHRALHVHLEYTPPEENIDKITVPMGTLWDWPDLSTDHDIIYLEGKLPRQWTDPAAPGVVSMEIRFPATIGYKVRFPNRLQADTKVVLTVLS